MITLFVQYYDAKNKTRQEEIDFCFLKNIENKNINQIIVLAENGIDVPFQSNKLTSIHITKRPTYRDWVTLSSEYVDEGLSVLINSDIYFDNSVMLMHQAFTERITLIALTRWDLQGDELVAHENPYWSQDTWCIAAADAKNACDLNGLDIPLGVPRCDNKVAYIFSISGWRVTNPCHFVKSYHKHESNMRTYDKADDRILGGVAYVNPSSNIEDESTLEFHIWTKRADKVKEVELNSYLQTMNSNKKEKSDIIEEIRDGNLRIENASAADILTAREHGIEIFRKDKSFGIYKHYGDYYFKNGYDLSLSKVLRKLSYDQVYIEYDKEQLKALYSVGFIPSVCSTFIQDLHSKPENKEDISFWQYPCSTEEQAYNNHIRRNLTFNIIGKTVNIYVGLPWATFIDKANLSNKYIKHTMWMIMLYRSIAEEANLDLRVHSCCQHIRWRRIVKAAHDIGVTDLYLSHKNSESIQVLNEEGYSLSLHGWPLIAVNYETVDRSAELTQIKVEDKKLLASFIGSQMDHYIDCSRLELRQAATSYNKKDVLVEISNEWHFNKHIYQEQVHHIPLSDNHQNKTENDAARYNKILSESKFSLCPIGAGPNTLRLWESIAIGIVPVLFSTDLAVFHEFSFSEKLLGNMIIWDKKIDATLFEYLASIPDEDIQLMQDNLIELYPSIANHTCF